MEARSFPEALKLIMERHGWSQTRLARELHVSQDWVSKASRGARDPAIGRVIRLLTSVGWEVVIRPKREESGPVKRREFHDKIIKVAAGTVAGKVAGVTFVPSAKVPMFGNPGYVTALADHLKLMRNEQGGGQLVSTARNHVEHVGIASVIAGRDRKLQVAAAKLVNIHALTLYDADRLDAAEGVAKVALALAQESQDPEIKALSYVTLSQIAAYAGAGDRGRHYAREGMKIPDISAALRAELYKREMRSLAILPGQEGAAFAAYIGIQNLDGRSSDAFHVDSFRGLNLNLGVALSDLGRHKSAIEAFSNSARHYASSSPHYFAQSLQGEILSLLHVGLPDVAADRMLTLAYVLPLINSARLQKDVNEVLDASSPWGKRYRQLRNTRDQLKAAIAPPRKRV